MRDQDRSPDEERYRLQAQFCRAMGHPKRQQILKALEGGEKCVQELAEATGMPQPNLSQHLSLMRSAGILDARRDGIRVYYRIADM